jgi:hypothetical protein
MNVLTQRVAFEDAPARGDRTVGLVLPNEPFERPKVRRRVELRQSLALDDEPRKVDSLEQIATAGRRNPFEFLDLGSIEDGKGGFD